MNEKLGVPNNIIDISIFIFNDIIKNIKLLYNFDDYTYTKNKSFKISDIEYSGYEINLYFNICDKIKITGLAFNDVMDIYNNKLKYEHDIISIDLSFDIKNNTTNNELIDYMNKNKSDIISYITHELKHSFDTNIGKEISDASLYLSITKNISKFSIKPIYNFIYLLYFSSNVETSVWLSETASNLINSKINKQNFLKFIEKNRCYVDFKKMKNFNVNSMIEELKSFKEYITEFLNKENIKFNKNNYIDKYLELVYINIVNDATEQFNEILEENDNIDEVLYSKFKKFISNLKKYENMPINYFFYCEKMFKFISEKYSRKILKLYDMIDNNKSIKLSHDLDLHNKINKKITENLTYSKKIKSFDEYFKNKKD